MPEEEKGAEIGTVPPARAEPPGPVPGQSVGKGKARFLELFAGYAGLSRAVREAGGEKVEVKDPADKLVGDRTLDLPGGPWRLF